MVLLVTRAFASVAIGGTNCSVALAMEDAEQFEWTGRRRFATLSTPGDVLDSLVRHLEDLVVESNVAQLAGIGIVCGGPLSESAGLVLSPPNLSLWDRIDVLTPFRQAFGVPVRLMNDANAGVLAEWMWGAAREKDDAVFLTMGTGLGAGLLLNGRLYQGASGLAGELGHWRLDVTGPNGYGKDGSFEGFCSGAGIGRWAQQVAAQSLQHGTPSDVALDWFDLADVNAQQLAKAADAGDAVALQLWSDVGRRLGAGLSLLVDLLNPDVIVIGGIYGRQRDRLEPTMLEELQREALPGVLLACRVVPSELGEKISDYSGLVAALVGDSSTNAGRTISNAVPSSRELRADLLSASGDDQRPHEAVKPVFHNAVNQDKGGS